MARSRVNMTGKLKFINQNDDDRNQSKMTLIPINLISRKYKFDTRANRIILSLGFISFRLP